MSKNGVTLKATKKKEKLLKNNHSTWLTNKEHLESHTHTKYSFSQNVLKTDLIISWFATGLSNSYSTEILLHQLVSNCCLGTAIPHMRTTLTAFPDHPCQRDSAISKSVSASEWGLPRLHSSSRMCFDWFIWLFALEATTGLKYFKYYHWDWRRPRDGQEVEESSTFNYCKTQQIISKN